MLIDTVFFYAFALLVLGGAILTITRRNAVHSAISLIVSLLGVAGLYLLQQAEFLFAVQIVLYVGGIMVLFLFVIMLVNLDQMAKERSSIGNGWWRWRRWRGGRGDRLLLLSRAARSTSRSPACRRPAALGNTERWPTSLFSEYLLPFEIASILLLVAVVGSVVMAKKRI
jgi:NADH-quinone oxidoreductase subunit J